MRRGGVQIPRLAHKSESGQSAILFAFVIIIMVVLVGLAIDGGNVLSLRRVTQNAADSGALAGAYHIVSSTGPDETFLQETINSEIGRAHV